MPPWPRKLHLNFSSAWSSWRRWSWALKRANTCAASSTASSKPSTSWPASPSQKTCPPPPTASLTRPTCAPPCAPTRSASTPPWPPAFYARPPRWKRGISSYRRYRIPKSRRVYGRVVVWEMVTHTLTLPYPHTVYMELPDQPAHHLVGQLKAGTITAVELLDATFRRIEAVEGRAPSTEAYAAQPGDEAAVHAYISLQR